MQLEYGLFTVLFFLLILMVVKCSLLCIGHRHNNCLAKGPPLLRCSPCLRSPLFFLSSAFILEISDSVLVFYIIS